MNIETEKYGVLGLPKFPINGKAVEATAISDLSAAFNNVIGVVKKHSKTGNNMGLWFFGFQLRSLFAIAEALVTEGPTHNA